MYYLRTPMAEELIIDKNLSKEAQYKTLIHQIEALIYGEENFIANVSNMVAAINQTFNLLWVGVYFVDGYSFGMIYLS